MIHFSCPFIDLSHDNGVCALTGDIHGHLIQVHGGHQSVQDGRVEQVLNQTHFASKSCKLIHFFLLQLTRDSVDGVLEVHPGCAQHVGQVAAHVGVLQDVLKDPGKTTRGGGIAVVTTAKNSACSDFVMCDKE